MCTFPHSQKCKICVPPHSLSCEVDQPFGKPGAWRTEARLLLLGVVEVCPPWPWYSHVDGDTFTLRVASSVVLKFSSVVYGVTQLRSESWASHSNHVTELAAVWLVCVRTPPAPSSVFLVFCLFHSDKVQGTEEVSLSAAEWKSPEHRHRCCIDPDYGSVTGRYNRSIGSQWVGPPPLLC